MNPLKTALFTAAALTLGACTMNDTASRNQPLDTPAQALAATAQAYRIADLNVSVPRTLRVSEANTYYPSADIVWRGDIAGDRYNQVGAIVETAGKRASSALKAGQGVVVDVQLTRFHSLTEKARYSVGGVHSIHFILTLRDPATGAVIESRPVDASFAAFGGRRAIDAEIRGDTQKVRIVDHLARTLVRELASQS